MMKSDETSYAENGTRAAEGAAYEEEIWLISAQRCIREKVGKLLAAVPATVRVIEWKFGEALPCAEASTLPKPAFVVLDICRDVTGGLQGIQLIRRQCGNVPLVVLTQDVSRAFGEKIISQGVAYYFTHEFPPEEFLDVSQNLLGLKRRHAQLQAGEHGQKDG